MVLTHVGVGHHVLGVKVQAREERALQHSVIERQGGVVQTENIVGEPSGNLQRVAALGDIAETVIGVSLPNRPGPRTFPVRGSAKPPNGLGRRSLASGPVVDRICWIGRARSGGVGWLRLADAGLALDKYRLVQIGGYLQSGGDAMGSYVSDVAKAGDDGLHGI